MRVYLFLDPMPNKGWQIRPVPFDNPDAGTVPSMLTATTSAMRWLADNDAPIWKSGMPGKQQCLALVEHLGYWPTPFEADDVVLLSEFEFNDSLEGIG